MNESFQTPPLPAKPRKRYFQATTQHCYTAREVRAKFGHMPKSAFFALKKQGKLPLIELLPRLGRTVRYHAAPIDQWLAGRGR